MKKLKDIKNIIKAELNLVIEDHSILLTVIIAPLLYAFFLGTIYIKKDIDRISFAVVDMDNSATTLKLTRLLSASSKIDVKGKLHSYEEAIDLMYKQKITGFLLFPSGFENPGSLFAVVKFHRWFQNSSGMEARAETLARSIPEDRCCKVAEQAN